jgi:hypothetical protein
MAPQKPKSRKRLWLIIGVVVILLIVIGSIASNANKSSQPTTTIQPAQPTVVPTQVPAQPTVVPTQAPTQPKTASFATFTDGTFQVGSDIKPGTYRTQTGSPGCYYARLKGFGGTIDDILANNNTDNPAIVTILPSDKGFVSQNCGTWTQDLSQITTSKTTFNDGMYIVGTDIQPGTYKNTGSSGCYYARLSGFSNTIDNIIANNNVDTSTIVTIAASDKGFESTQCGTWTKL